jgi:hypothetical protein
MLFEEESSTRQIDEKRNRDIDWQCLVRLRCVPPALRFVERFFFKFFNQRTVKVCSL